MQITSRIMADRSARTGLQNEISGYANGIIQLQNEIIQITWRIMADRSARTGW